MTLALARLRRPFRPRGWLRAHFTEFAFLLIIAVYGFASIRSNLNIGVRHLLPVFPLVYILVASQVAALYRRLERRAARVAPPGAQSEREEARPNRSRAAWAYGLTIAGLMAWQATTVLRVHPSYLAYFNELAGGPESGYRYVVDSNLDWGQDLKRLARFVERQGISQIAFDYWGDADPAYYLKDKYRMITSCTEPQQGWVAVSVMYYQESRRKPECDYRRWLPRERLFATIGYSIFVFRMD